MLIRNTPTFILILTCFSFIMGAATEAFIAITPLVAISVAIQFVCQLSVRYSKLGFWGTMGATMLFSTVFIVGALVVAAVFSEPTPEHLQEIESLGISIGAGGTLLIGILVAYSKKDAPDFRPEHFE